MVQYGSFSCRKKICKGLAFFSKYLTGRLLKRFFHHIVVWTLAVRHSNSLSLNAIQKIVTKSTRNSWSQTAQPSETSPNLRFCFIKRAHRMTLLERLWAKVVIAAFIFGQHLLCLKWRALYHPIRINFYLIGRVSWILPKNFLQI